MSDAPNGRFLRELKNVAKDATALSEHLQTANQLPNDLPESLVKLLCRTLVMLPQGSTEGAVESLLYAQERIPAWRADCFPAPDDDEEDDDFATVERDGRLDDRLSRLYSSVGSALAVYKADTGEQIESDVTPEPPLEPEEAEAAGLPDVERSAADTASQAAELRATLSEDTENADEISRSLTDTANAARNAQVESGQPRPLMSLLRKTGNALKRTAKTTWAVCLDAESGGKEGAKLWGDLNRWAIESLLKSVQATARTIDKAVRFVGGKWDDTVERPTPDFDEELVHEMLLRGEKPPKHWQPLIEKINLEGQSEFTDTWLLSGLSELKTLYLFRTGVSDISALSGLPALLSLGLVGTDVTDISALSTLPTLWSLGLTGTPVSDVSPLSGLTSLEWLGLNRTNVTDISALSGLSALAALNLSNTSVTDISALSGLSALESLNLSNTSVTDISALSGLSALESLNLSNTFVSNVSVLSGLTALKTLDLSETQVTDLSPIQHLIDAGLEVTGS